MRTKILAATCLGLVGLSAAHAGDEFFFRVRKAPRAVKVEKSSPEEVNPTRDAYLARKGDTLWDVAGRYWSSSRSWPELWALNPHFRNPHRVDPGDPIYLTRGGRGAEIRLPIEPADLGGSRASAAQGPETTPAATGEGGPQAASIVPIRMARAQAGHFVSSHRIARLASVQGQAILRSAYVVGDEVSLSLSGDAHLKPGDLVTIFDDSLPVVHPVNRSGQGYLVCVLGHLQVQSVSRGRAVGKIVETYDAVPEGAGIMPYRRPVASITPQVAKAGVQGVVLGGMPNQTLLGMEDVVFLDRGSIHGLKSGDVLEVPLPELQEFFGGLIDLERPIARILVISVEDKTATGLILANRLSVLPGFRFMAAMLSP